MSKQHDGDNGQATNAPQHEQQVIMHPAIHAAQSAQTVYPQMIPYPATYPFMSSYPMGGPGGTAQPSQPVTQPWVMSMNVNAHPATNSQPPQHVQLQTMPHALLQTLPPSMLPSMLQASTYMQHPMNPQILQRATLPNQQQGFFTLPILSQQPPQPQATQPFTNKQQEQQQQRPQRGGTVSYHDYSTHDPEGFMPTAVTRNKHLSFVENLHKILSDKLYEDCVCWFPHGRSWKVTNQEKFEEEVIPRFFRHSKFASFMRQVRTTCAHGVLYCNRSVLQMLGVCVCVCVCELSSLATSDRYVIYSRNRERLNRLHSPMVLPHTR